MKTIMQKYSSLEEIPVYDVLVIGAGMTGAIILRELSRFNLRIVVVEKDTQPGLGVTRTSLSYIHRNHVNPPGSLRAKLCHGSQESFRALSAELGLGYREADEINIAFNKEQASHVRQRMDWGIKNGETTFRVISNEEVARIEPSLNQDFIFATISKDHGMIHPPEWAFVLIENARKNNADAFFETEVTAIKHAPDGNWNVGTNRGTLRARYVINAAGVYADHIAHIVGDRDINQFMARSTFAIFDSSIASIINHIVYVGGLNPAWSQSISQTLHGNLLLGLGHFQTPDNPIDTKVTREELEDLLRMGKEMIPSLPLNQLITSFAGMRLTNNLGANGDFYIGPSSVAPTLFHTLICPPGITAAPGIAREMLNILSNAGLDLKEKPDFQGYRDPGYRFHYATDIERNAAIKKNPACGHLVCRCEQVSEAEIRDAIRRGATTIDGVKQMTRAGMGRCQGGFCSPLVLKLLSEELDIPPEKVTRKGKGSEELVAWDEIKEEQ